MATTSLSATATTVPSPAPFPSSKPDGGAAQAATLLTAMGETIMKIRTTGLFYALLAVGGSLTFAAPASAQATRTWVSGVGDDANPCSRTAPCRTFAGSI